MEIKQLEKRIKKKREILAVYKSSATSSILRRIYPETFYASDNVVSPHEIDYIAFIYDIFQTIIVNHRKVIIEDEINLIYAEIESNIGSGKFPEIVISAIQERLDLKKQILHEIEELATKAERELSEFHYQPRHIVYRLESTTYLIRLLAYGLFTENDVVFERVAEVFDADELKFATKSKDKHSMDNALKFLYKGLIQRNESGRQGNIRAAKETLDTLRKWYSDNMYVISCIDKIEKYV